MNEFYREVAERKRAIRGYGKVGQSKRRAIMPSDYLTPKQRKELDGEVVTYNFGKSLDYETFKTYPHEIQQEWVNAFQKRWGLGYEYMARVLGTNKAAIWNYCKDNNLSVIAKRGKPGKRNVMKFEELLRSEKEPLTVEVHEAVPEEQTEQPVFKSGVLEIQGMAGICLEAIYKAIGDHSVKLRVEWSTAE